MTETGKPLKDDCFHAPLPSGPAGQFSYHVPFSNLVPTYAKNQKAAKDFLRWFHSKEIYDAWFTSQQGFSVGATKAWENHKLWKVDPVMAPFRTAAESGRFAGYAGPAGRRPQRRSASSSSSTCTPRPCKAWQRKKRSNGPMLSW